MRSTRVVVALLLTGAVAACSSPAAPAAPAAAARTTTAAPTVTCKQLTATDVQGLMTNPVAGDDVTAVGTDADGQRCVFHDDGSEQAVDVIVVPAADTTVGWAQAKQAHADAIAVPGVGDEAFRDPNDYTIYARHAGIECTISLGATDQVPGVNALIVNGSLNLTEAQNAVLAAALGTVCNRVFGSGDTTPDLSGLKS